MEYVVFILVIIVILLVKGKDGPVVSITALNGNVLYFGKKSKDPLAGAGGFSKLGRRSKEPKHLAK